MPTDDDPMAFLNAQRAKLAALAEAAEASTAQSVAATDLSRRMLELEANAADAMAAPVVTELTSEELAKLAAAEHEATPRRESETDGARLLAEPAVRAAKAPGSAVCAAFDVRRLLCFW